MALKLSSLSPSDVSMVQQADSGSAPLKLSALNDGDAQLVQSASDSQPGVIGQTWNSLKNFTGSMADAGAKAVTLGYLDTPDMEANMAKSPTGKAVGTVVGGIPVGLATGAGVTTALGPLAEASGLVPAAARIGANTAAGAGLGFAAKPEGDNSLDARLMNAKFGGEFGGALSTAGESLSAAGNYVAGKWSDYAADKAAKAIGMTKADYKRMGPDAARALGREALDRTIVRPFSTPSSIEASTDEMKQAAGERLGNVIDQAQSRLDQMPATGMMPAGKPVQASPLRPTFSYGPAQTQSIPISPIQTVSPDISGVNPSEFTPRRINGSPEPTDWQLAEMARAGDQSAKTNLQVANSSGFNPYESNPTAEVSTIERGFEKTRPEDFVTAVKPRPAGTINAPAIAAKLRSTADIATLSKTPGMEGTASKIGGFLESLEKNPQDMSLRDAQELRQGIDKSINWARRQPDMAAAQQHLVDIRNALSDAMNESVDQASSVSGEPLGALRQANKDYSTLSKIQSIASNRNAMNSANRSIGLTDTIAGAGAGAAGAGVGGAVAGPGGAVAGEMVGNAVGAGTNKFARTFGPSLQATGANAVAKTVSGAANFARGNPAAALPLVASAVNGRGTDQSNQDQPTMLGGTPSTGPTAWAQKGLKNLGITDVNLSNRILKDPKGQNLLIQASSFPPGSRALKAIASQIQSQWGNS